MAISDVIRVQASKMRKIHDARKYSWDLEHAAVADLAQDLNHDIQLQTKELQKLDEARERAWHVEWGAAAEQLAGARFEQVGVASEAAAGTDQERDPRRRSRCGRCENQGDELHDDGYAAKARVAELHDDGYAAKSGRDELHDRMHLAAMVTAAVDTATTQLQAVESRCIKMIKGHEKRVDAEFVKLTERQHEGVKMLSCPTCSEEPEPEPVVQNGVNGESRVICECRSAPALLQSMDVYAGDPQLL